MQIRADKYANLEGQYRRHLKQILKSIPGRDNHMCKYRLERGIKKGQELKRREIQPVPQAAFNGLYGVKHNQEPLKGL